ncbi:MAG: Rab family GTPase [Candidatus Hodarchaeales archaeon]
MTLEQLLKPNNLKIAVLGEGGIGKTTLCQTYNRQQTFLDTKQTIAVEFHVTRRIFRGEEYRIQIWDLGGQKQFREMGVFSKYCRGIQGAIACFDLTDIETLFIIPKWLKFIPSDIPVILVGTKADLSGVDDFILEEVRDIVTKYGIVEFIETSAMNYETIENVFQSLLSRIIDTRSQGLDFPRLLATKY